MATFDPNIVLQAKPLTDPMESYGRALTLKTIGQQQKMQEAQMAKYEEDRAAETALNELYRSSVDPTGKVDRNALLSGAASRGLGSRIPTLQKGFAEHDKAMADVKKTSVETQAAGAKLISEGMARLASNPNVTHQDVIAWAASLPSDVIDPNQTAQIIRTLPPGPALRQTLMMYGANADARLQALTPQIQAVNLGGTTRLVDKNVFTNPQASGQVFQQTQSPDSAAAVAATIRGQNIARDAALQGGSVQTDAQGNMIVVPNRFAPGVPVQSSPVVGAGGEPVRGKTADNLSEGERKAATLLSRLRFSENQLKAALTNNEKVAKPGALAETVRAVAGDTAANVLTPAARQQVEAAQLDILDAALTLGTGAAYTKEQLKGYAKSYFPQIGDDDKTIADKQDRLANVIQAAEIAAGRGASQVPKAGTPKRPPVPIKTDADYNSLPSGTVFLAPDGTERVKP